MTENKEKAPFRIQALKACIHQVLQRLSFDGDPDGGRANSVQKQEKEEAVLP